MLPRWSKFYSLIKSYKYKKFEVFERVVHVLRMTLGYHANRSENRLSNEPNLPQLLLL